MNKILTISLIVGVILFVAGQLTFEWIGYLGLVLMLIPIVVMVYYATINFFKDMFRWF